MAGGKWMVRIWKAGNMSDMSKFYVPRSKTEPMKAGKGSSQRKKDANGSQAIRRLARILNANFHPGDFLLTFHFDAPGLLRVGADHDAADHQLMLCLRRMQYAYKKRGEALRYVGITSEKDEATFAPVRLHCHAVVSGALIAKPEGSREYLLSGKPLSQVWGYGTVDVQSIRHEDDHTGLAVYLCRQARCLPDEKRWHPSRNLLKPEWVDVELNRDAVRAYNQHKRRGMPPLKVGADGRLLVPARCTSLEDGQYIPAIGTHYIRFLLPEARKLPPAIPAGQRRGKGRRL